MSKDKVRTNPTGLKALAENKTENKVAKEARFDELEKNQTNQKDMCGALCLCMPMHAF